MNLNSSKARLTLSSPPVRSKQTISFRRRAKSLKSKVPIRNSDHIPELERTIENLCDKNRAIFSENDKLAKKAESLLRLKYSEINNTYWRRVDELASRLLLSKEDSLNSRNHLLDSEYKLFKTITNLLESQNFLEKIMSFIGVRPRRVALLWDSVSLGFGYSETYLLQNGKAVDYTAHFARPAAVALQTWLKRHMPFKAQLSISGTCKTNLLNLELFPSSAVTHNCTQMNESLVWHQQVLILGQKPVGITDTSRNSTLVHVETPAQVWLEHFECHPRDSI